MHVVADIEDRVDTRSRRLAHAPVQYVPDIAQFLIVVFVLAWAWGFIIQRTEALWGAVLFHAGADLIIILGIFKTYGAA